MKRQKAKVFSSNGATPPPERYVFRERADGPEVAMELVDTVTGKVLFYSVWPHIGGRWFNDVRDGTSVFWRSNRGGVFDGFKCRTTVEEILEERQRDEKYARACDRYTEACQAGADPAELKRLHELADRLYPLKPV